MFSKRSTRAGSEAKSPPATSRVTRRMRASSMEPEVNVEVIETPPVKSKRRASVLPSEATVEEEKEVMKIVVITLDRALPNVKESSESGTIFFKYHSHDIFTFDLRIFKAYDNCNELHFRLGQFV